MELLLGHSIDFLSLLELEFELFAFSIALSLLVFLPVFDTLLVPLLHKACIALKFIDLDAAHFLFSHGGYLLFFLLVAGSIRSLPLFLFFKLMEMRFHVELFLRFVECVDASFEELVLNSVVFLF